MDRTQEQKFSLSWAESEVDGSKDYTGLRYERNMKFSNSGEGFKNKDYHHETSRVDYLHKDNLFCITTNKFYV